MRTGIEQENSDYLLTVFSRAKEARDEFTVQLAKRNASNMDE
jgi:cyclohexadieny/prephenate dehydrogenase